MAVVDKSFTKMYKLNVPVEAEKYGGLKTLVQCAGMCVPKFAMEVIFQLRHLLNTEHIRCDPDKSE